MCDQMVMATVTRGLTAITIYPYGHISELIDAEWLAIRLFKNDGDNWLIFSLTEDATAVLTNDKLMNSILQTVIETNRSDGNGSQHIGGRRTPVRATRCGFYR